jgi:hypothetical protein
MGVVTPTNLYNMIDQMWILMGFKNTSKFVTDPATSGPNIPPEIADAVFKLLAQQGVDIDGAINQAAAEVEASKNQPQAGGGAPSQAPANSGVL